MATKIRGRQIETDDFIKSLRNADTDWTNDVNTASQKAVAALVSGKFKVVKISYDSNHDVFSADTSIADIISWAANGYYVVALFCMQQSAGLRGTGILFELSYFFDLQRQKKVEFRNTGYHESQDAVECLSGETQYDNGQWTDDDWSLEPHHISYENLQDVPTNLVNSYTVSNPALRSDVTHCKWVIQKSDFGNKSGEDAILILKESGKQVTPDTIMYTADHIEVNILSRTDIPAGTYEAVIHA